MKEKQNTSWGGVSDWYDDYLQKENSYQQQVILPNLLRAVNSQLGEKLLDLACGQGFFTRAFAEARADVVGADISPELIEKAREYSPNLRFEVASADNLAFAKDGEYTIVTCVLALQNIENILGVFKEVRRVLTPDGRFVFVLNHPAFRVLKRSSWGWDEEKQIQYRRVDGYLSGGKVLVDIHPGKSEKSETVSFHRSLQDFFKALSGSGLVVTKLEEWISHKKSEEGPRQKAEDTARKEIPLFLMIETRPHTL